MSGETDLAKILETLTVRRRSDLYTVITSTESISLGDGIAAIITEDEGTTAIVTVAEAGHRGWSVEFVAAWLTIEVHSSLEAVGLTAALSNVLAEAGISCNVVAAYFHDHLLVPADRADDAIAAIGSLRTA